MFVPLNRGTADIVSAPVTTRVVEKVPEVKEPARVPPVMSVVSAMVPEVLGPVRSPVPVAILPPPMVSMKPLPLVRIYPPVAVVIYPPAAMVMSSAIVSVREPVAVIATPLMLVAVAAPNTGATNVLFVIPASVLV